ncbi:MAG: hypothetical protein E7311_06510 [Clostridiales bacterium]|nr:hypothetical protein [Clostridiales bacterium]
MNHKTYLGYRRSLNRNQTQQNQMVISIGNKENPLNKLIATLKSFGDFSIAYLSSEYVKKMKEMDVLSYENDECLKIKNEEEKLSMRLTKQHGGDYVLSSLQNGDLTFIGEKKYCKTVLQFKLKCEQV